MTGSPASDAVAGCSANDTGYHRLNVDGQCSDCDEQITPMEYVIRLCRHGFVKAADQCHFCKEERPA